MQYSVIYADPPYEFKVWSDKNNTRCAKHHYDTMSLDAIKSFDMSSIANENSVLFLWVVNSMLPEGLRLMEHWGFTYKTVAFTWVKKNKKSDTFFVGLGYYTRQNPELCLLGTRGKGLKRISKGVRNLVVERIREHSRKPDIVRDYIVELYGNVPRIELFARCRTDGWDTFGDQCDLF
jgi:N6-adenosine-specific RNA methylase IME4